MNDTETLMQALPAADFAAVDFARPVTVVRLATHLQGDVPVFGLANEEAYVQALGPTFTKVPGASNVYTDGPAGTGMYIGIANRTAVFRGEGFRKDERLGGVHRQQPQEDHSAYLGLRHCGW